MDEDELITHIAAGTDIWTALAATADDDKPPRRKGCLGALLVLVCVIVYAIWSW